MNCWHCDRPAHAVCAFCGRATCRDDVRALPLPLAIWRDRSGMLQSLVTADAVHCGACKPTGRPVPLTELDT
jgi:hypothetical protein